MEEEEEENGAGYENSIFCYLIVQGLATEQKMKLTTFAL